MFLLLTTEGSFVNKRDLQTLYLSGTYCHKTSNRPPSCVTPQQPTIYTSNFNSTHYFFHTLCIIFLDESLNVQLLTIHWQISWLPAPRAQSYASNLILWSFRATLTMIGKWRKNHLRKIMKVELLKEAIYNVTLCNVKMFKIISWYTIS